MGEGAADDQVAEQHRRWSWWQVLLHPFAAYDDVVEDLRSADDNTYREIGFAPKKKSGCWVFILLANICLLVTTTACVLLPLRCRYVVAVALNTALLLTKLGLPQSWKVRGSNGPPRVGRASFRAT